MHFDHITLLHKPGILCGPQKRLSTKFRVGLISFLPRSGVNQGVGSDGKESAYNVGDLGLIPGSGRSPEEGNGYLLQYSCLENPLDSGAWWATVHGVAKSQT